MPKSAVALFYCILLTWFEDFWALICLFSQLTLSLIILSIMSVDSSIIVILGLLMPFPTVQSSSDIVSLATEFFMYSISPPHPPLAAYSVAKDDVVISTKGWVCISPPEDIICVHLCRQPENGEWWQQRGRKLLFLIPYQLSAPYCSHLLLSQTITSVALFTRPWYSSLPHLSTLLALSTGDPQQQTHELENADELTHINRLNLTVFQVKSTSDLMSWITILMCRGKTKCVFTCSSVSCICFI